MRVLQRRDGSAPHQEQHWHKGRLYIIDNIEAQVCQECGERYFHAHVLDKIDAIIEGDQWHSLVEKE
jgi:YgiT-type zinc finger domain-containing protein